MTVLLQARSVTKRYGNFTAVSGVDLEIRAASVHSVIGPNGAGKTTLFHVLTGAVPITAGTIHVDGEDISLLPGYKRVRKGLGRSFQVTSLFQNLPVRENLRVAAQGRSPWDVLRIWPSGSRGENPDRIVDELLERFSLGPVMGRPAGELSHGQQRRLEVAMAMTARPRVIFLDEPTSGMGIDDIQEMTQLIVALRDEGYAVVLVEHNMDIVMGVSDVITVMQSGRVLVEGKPDDIRSDPRVREAYLGSMLTGGRQ